MCCCCCCFLLVFGCWGMFRRQQHNTCERKLPHEANSPPLHLYTRHIGGYLAVFHSASKYPEVARCTVKYSGVTRGSVKYCEVPWLTPKRFKALKNISKYPEYLQVLSSPVSLSTFEYLGVRTKYLQVSRSILQCLKTPTSAVSEYPAVEYCVTRELVRNTELTSKVPARTTSVYRVCARNGKDVDVAECKFLHTLKSTSSNIRCFSGAFYHIAHTVAYFGHCCSSSLHPRLRLNIRCNKRNDTGKKTAATTTTPSENISKCDFCYW